MKLSNYLILVNAILSCICVHAQQPSGVAWHHNEPIAIYSQCQIAGSYDSPIVVSSLGSNMPRGGTIVARAGKTGSILWSKGPLTNWKVAVSATHVAASQCNVSKTDATCLIQVVHASDGNAVWQTTITNGQVIELKFAPDGSGLFVLSVNGPPPYPTKSFKSVLSEYNSETGLEEWSWISAAQQQVHTLHVSTSALAVVDQTNVILVARTTGKLLFQAPFNFATDTLCLSPSGNSFGYGFQVLDVYTASSSKPDTYNKTLTLTMDPGFLVGECAISPQDEYIVGAWYKETYKQIATVLYSGSSGTQKWRYNYHSDVGSPDQDVPSAIATGENAFVVGSWGGNSSKYAKEVHLFSYNAASKGAPDFVLESAGSIFDVGLVEDSAGKNALVSACGKHVPANQMGDGGDLYVNQAIIY